VVDDEEHVTSLKLPQNVVHAPPGKSLQSMMASGEIQAGFTGPGGVGRAGPPIGGWDEVSQTIPADTYPELIANAEKAESEWFHRTGIYPIHGLIVVKDEHVPVARAFIDGCIRCGQEALSRKHQVRPRRHRGRQSLSGLLIAYVRSAAVWHQFQPCQH